MASGFTFGGLGSEYAMTFQMSDTATVVSGGETVLIPMLKVLWLLQLTENSLLRIVFV